MKKNPKFTHFLSVFPSFTSSVTTELGRRFTEAEKKAGVVEILQSQLVHGLLKEL